MDFSNEARNLQIGDYLQTLRLEQDLTLEQLSHLSQVPVVHLTSIEEGRFLRFDNFYLKMYLKRYTQALDVDLDQLYAYASQQPLSERSVDASNERKVSERQMTQTQADISSIPKKMDHALPKRQKPTVKSANVARLEAKQRIGKFIIGFVFILLLILTVIFFVRLIIDLHGNEPTYTDSAPLIVDNPHTIVTPDTENDEDDEEVEDDDAYEEEPEETPEEEPEIIAHTIIEFDSHVGLTQSFDVVTTFEEIELVIQFSGYCWLDLRFNNTTVQVGTFDSTITLEETFELDGSNDAFIHLDVGSLQDVESISLNGEYVDFDGAHIVQSLRFNIEVETD
ncbi:MAG: helix-turn-helix domain-containing protein [Defluviitaleaceae bacterium]|nr:helix-turn-helix domain-containing protein [Defluviitaleaceae bacterium]